MNVHSLSVKYILALVDHDAFYQHNNSICVFASLSIPILIRFVHMHGQVRSFEVRVVTFVDQPVHRIFHVISLLQLI